MSLPRYPTYKASRVQWLGEVPDHWEVCAAKRWISSRAGGTLIKGECASEPDEGLFPAFSASGQDVWVEAAAYVQPGIVLSAVGARCGKTFRADGAWGVVANTHCLFPLQSANRDFLWYLTNQEDWWERGGTAQPFIKVSETLARCWVFPTPDEQAAIAKFLDRETAKIDALIAEQGKLIALLAEKRQATIAHAVTRGLDPSAQMKDSGVSWIGEVPAHWEVAPLKRFWSVTDCKHLTAEFVDDGYPLASIREVQSRYVALDEAKRTTQHFYLQLIEGGRKPLPGDLIFSRNATVGEIAQVAEEHPAFAMGQDVCLLRRLDASASPDYLQDVVRSGVVVEQLKNIMVGSTFKRVNVEEIRCLVVPMPPSSEQRQIAEFLKSERMRFEAIEQDAGWSISLLRERRSALITAAVTGQIDVRQTIAGVFS